MVASGGSIPATPGMMAALPNTGEWARAWVESFEGEIAADAETFTNQLAAKGFYSRRSLRGMRGQSAGELANLLGVPYGVASEFKAEAEAIHGGAVMQVPQIQELAGDDGNRAIAATTWKEFAVKLRSGSSQAKVPTKKELDTYAARLLPYVAAQRLCSSVAGGEGIPAEPRLRRAHLRRY